MNPVNAMLQIGCEIAEHVMVDSYGEFPQRKQAAFKADFLFFH